MPQTFDINFTVRVSVDVIPTVAPQAEADEAKVATPPAPPKPPKRKPDATPTTTPPPPAETAKVDADGKPILALVAEDSP